MNKIIYCSNCFDMKTLRKKLTRCVCGKSLGIMIDNNSAKINEAAIPIGLSTKTFQFALSNRPDTGLGIPFTAFVIANSNKNIEVISTKELVEAYGGEAYSPTKTS